jgi:hypothetical protein
VLFHWVTRGFPARPTHPAWGGWAGGGNQHAQHGNGPGEFFMIAKQVLFYSYPQTWNFLSKES